MLPGAGALSASGAGAVTSGAGLTGCSGPGSSIIVFPSGAGGVSVGFSVGENSTATSFSVFSAILGYSAVVVSAGAVVADKVVSGTALVVSSNSGAVSEDDSTHSCEAVEGGGSSAVNWPVSYTHLDVYKRQSEGEIITV